MKTKTKYIKEIEDLRKLVISGARKIIKTKQQLIPTFFVPTISKNCLKIVPCNFADQEQKDQTFDAMRKLVILEKPKFYAFISEVWYLVHDKDSKERITAPSDSPNKKEALMLTFYTNEVYEILYVYSIDRTKGTIKLMKKDETGTSHSKANFYIEKEGTIEAITKAINDINNNI